MKIFFTILILLSIRSHAISQVGPKSIGDEDQNFELLLPLNFPDIHQLNDTDLKVRERVFGFNAQVDATYFFLPANKIIDSQFADTQKFINYMEMNGWTEIPTDDCRLSFIIMNGNTIKAVSYWSLNEGLAIISPKERIAKKHILKMIANMKIREDLCPWK